MNRYKLAKAGVDANEGIRRLNNDKEMYEAMLHRFLENVYYDKMLIAISDRDVHTAFQAAHALKGLSGNLSFVQLHAALIPLVEELRKGSLEQTETLLAPVKDAYLILVEAIKGE